MVKGADELWAAFRSNALGHCQSTQRLDQMNWKPLQVSPRSQHVAGRQEQFRCHSGQNQPHRVSLVISPPFDIRNRTFQPITQVLASSRSRIVERS